MKTCLIVSGGEFNDLPVNVDANCIIACDRGYEHVKRMGLTPDIIIGDYDSMSLESIEADLKARGLTEVKILRFPSHKDDSDTMLAVKHALSEGYDNIVLTCALGGQVRSFFCQYPDHGLRRGAWGSLHSVRGRGDPVCYKERLSIPESPQKSGPFRVLAFR